MRKMIVLTFLLLVVTVSSAFASVKNGIGAGLGMVGSYPAATLKMRGLSVTPLEFQYSYVLGAGQEANINLYLLYAKYFKLHLIDPGVYIGKPLGVNISQKYDVSLGGGIESTIWRRLVIFVSVRVYLPDPDTAYKLIDSQAQVAGANSVAQNGNANQISGDVKSSVYSSVNDIYGAALRNYKISFGAMWFFW